MNTLFRCMFACTFLTLTACESVYVEQPLGEEVVVLDEARWQGTWLNGEVVITTTVIDAEKGILQAAWIERGAQGAELEIVTGYVRKSGDWIYLNLPDYDKEAEPVVEKEPDSELPVVKPPEFRWVRMVLDDRAATLWWPSQDRFREAVKSGSMPGRIKDDNDVLLSELTAEHLQQINSPEANLLNWTEPLVFLRIAD